MSEDRFLGNLSSFSMLSLAEIDEIYAKSKTRKYTKNQVLFYGGDEMTHLYILSSGYVRLEKNDEEDKFRYLDFLNREKLFPVMGMPDADVYAYSAIAQTDIEIRIIPIAVIRQLLDTNTDFLRYWIGYQSDIIRKYMTRIQGMSVNSALDRVTGVLKVLAFSIGERNVVTQHIELGCPIAIKDIAVMSGTTRETAGIMIKRLVNMGCIDYQHKQFVYLDRFLKKGGEL